MFDFSVYAAKMSTVISIGALTCIAEVNHLEILSRTAGKGTSDLSGFLLKQARKVTLLCLFLSGSDLLLFFQGLFLEH